MGIRRFDGKMIQPPEMLEKRAESRQSGARCVGQFFVEKTTSLLQFIKLLTVVLLKPREG